MKSKLPRRTERRQSASHHRFINEVDRAHAHASAVGRNMALIYAEESYLRVFRENYASHYVEAFLDALDDGAAS